MNRRCFTALLILTTLLCSCKKEIDSIGLNLQDDDILNASFIEIPLEAHSILEDSINTKNLLNNVVGSIQDPVFGRTDAGFCTQFGLSGSNTSFSSSAVLDSVVLTMQYSGFYGDTLSGLQFEVHKLAEQLDQSYYYSNQDNPSVESENLVYSSSLVYPQPNTSVTLDTLAIAPHIRLRLKGSFGSWLMSLSDEELEDATSLQQVFAGLCVRARQTRRGAGNLSYVSLTSSASGITLYYHLNGESRKYTFPVTTDCVRYNFFTHDYSTANASFIQQVINGDPLLGRQELYVQAMSGVKTRVNVSALSDSLCGKNVVINRAELVLTNLNPSELYFLQPNNLSLQVVNENGTTSYTPDDATYTSTSYFGGIYNEAKKEYRFRITNYVQDWVRHNGGNNGLNIVISGAGVRGNRLAFRGTDPSYADHFRLEVYYTEY